MFEKLTVPSRDKDDAQHVPKDSSISEEAQRAPLICTGLMFASLVMPALAGRASANEPSRSPNIEYVIRNDDRPEIENAISSEVDISAPVATMTMSSEIAKDKPSEVSPWIKAVGALAAGVLRVIAALNNDKEEDDDDN